MDLHRLLPGPSDRAHESGLEVDLSDGVVFQVGQVEDVISKRHTLWRLEPSRPEVAVLESWLAAANRILDHSVEASHEDDAMPRVRDEHPRRRLVGQDLAGEKERRLALEAPLQARPERLVRQ